MASTRNYNSVNDYNLQQKSKDHYYQLLIDKDNRPPRELLPNIGPYPSHISREALSNNYIDIESSMLGIGSNNFVQPNKPVQPELKYLDDIDFFDRQHNVFMPKPYIHDYDQRPKL